jgi:YggT family protein
MLATAFIFLIETAAGLFTVALLLRFLLQWARTAPRNPISDFLNALTNWAVRPARRFIPGLWGLDLATLLLAWLTQFIELFVVLQLRGFPFGAQALLALALLAAVALVRLLLYIVIVVVIVQAVMSWVNPYSPISPLLNAITRPLLRPFQRRIPPVANVDLSPLFVIIVCQLLLIVPVAYAEKVFMGLLAVR